MGIAYFGSFVKITSLAHIFGLLFTPSEGLALFFDKMYWATFWAILSQTHLITLIT
jgi:hypothetical protein